MGSISDYLENALLDHVLKVGTFAVPTNIYIALSTTDPLDDASGLTEPSGGSYARILCNVWDAAASRRTQNTAQITFATATGAWGEVTHFAIVDALVGGNMLAHGMLFEHRIVTTGKTILFKAGELDIYWKPGGLSNYLANALLDHVFKTASYTVPTNIYVALAADTINDATDGTSIEEPSDMSYDRVNVNAWDAAVGGVSYNTNQIDFSTVVNDWGDITDVALLDANSGGNVLFYGKWTEIIQALVGVTISFNAGDLGIEMK